MKKTILHIFFSFFACILSLPASAQGIPVLAGDPDVTRESLPDGITCYLVPNPSYKGLADFALVLQGRDVSSKVGPIGTELPDSLPRFTACSPSSFLARNGIRRWRNGYVQSLDGASVVRFENVRLPAGEPVTDSLLLMMFDLVDISGMPGRAAMIISGDIDRDEMLKKLRILSLMVPGRDGEAAPYAEAWTPRDSASCSVLSGGSPGTASLTVSYVSPRTPAEYMSTALPAVSERLSDEFRSVLLSRLSCRLRRDSVPAAGITYSQRLSSDAAGPEQRSVTILTSDTCVLKEASSAGNVFSSLCGAGAELDEYVSAKSMALAGLGREAGRPLVPNSFNVDRCVSSFLYGTALVSAAEKLRFHQKGELPDTCGLRLFNSFISELADSSRNLILTCRTSSGAVSSDTLLAAFVSGWRSALSDTLSGGGCHVDMRDTMRFPVPVTRASLRRTRTDSSTGTSTWTFSNGMKVVYRKMPTSGRLFYSFVLRAGYSSMRNMKDGEGAFLAGDLHRVPHVRRRPLPGLLLRQVGEDALKVQSLVLQVLLQLRPHRLPVRLEADARRGLVQPLDHRTQSGFHGFSSPLLLLQCASGLCRPRHRPLPHRTAVPVKQLQPPKRKSLLRGKRIRSYKCSGKPQGRA